jgi:hypothetical protein
MKIKIRAEDASTPHIDGWLQMDEWLAELREGHRAEPPGGNDVKPDDTGISRSSALAQARAESDARAQADARAWADARAQAEARAWAEAHAQAEARARVQARAEPRGGAGAGARAVIGDQLRIPIMWCELGPCIAWYSDPAALGEADTRARAIAAGWRVDALGRLACPSCQQTDPFFWTARRVVPWDRYAAMVRAARAAGLSQRG